MRNQFAGLGSHTLWFVTRPTPDSGIEDILFKIKTWRDLSYQFCGGLDPDDIVDVFVDGNRARDLARHLLAAATGGHR